MARVTVEDCLERVSNRFALTVLASRRARALSEGRGAPLVECNNKDAVTALREIGADGVRYTENVDEVVAGYIREQRGVLLAGSNPDHTFLDAASFAGGGLDDEDDDDDLPELSAELKMDAGSDDSGEGEESEKEDGQGPELPEGADSLEGDEDGDDDGDDNDDD